MNVKTRVIQRFGTIAGFRSLRTEVDDVADAQGIKKVQVFGVHESKVARTEIDAFLKMAQGRGSAPEVHEIG
jgi:hypothetical protein